MFGRTKETEELLPVASRRDFSNLEEMERWFDEIFRSPFFQFRKPLIPTRWLHDRPCVDILEEGGDLVVKAELPGMKKEDIRINLVDDILTIAGEGKGEEKLERKDYYRMERSTGSFKRSFRVPVDIQVDKVKAAFKDGILEVRMPKTEESRRKEVKVEVH